MTTSKDDQSPNLVGSGRQEVEVVSVFAECAERGCGWYFVETQQNTMRGRNQARTHTLTTGHRTTLEIVREETTTYDQ